MRARTSRSHTPKWMKRLMLAQALAAISGSENWIARAWPLCQMESRATTSSISLLAARDFYWGMERSATDAKRSWRATTWRIYGAACLPSLNLQHINNPGYNRVRGPVIVPSLRLHVDF